MNFDELFKKRSLHIKPGLERIRRSYDFLGRPAASIPSVLIGGTNGKGSTSGFLWSLLAQSLRRVALYSSPHLVNFSERFLLSNRQTSDAEIIEQWETLALPSDLYEELSFFEVATLIAFRLFEEQEAEFQVLEVGLGGRWDACNISEPLVSVLVSVSLDHEAYLGHSLEGILDEKLGILRSGRPLFWGNGGEICQVPNYETRIANAAAQLGCPLYQFPEHFSVDQDHLILRLPGLPSLRLPLDGRLTRLAPFLKKNLALAAAVYHELANRCPSLGLRPIDQIWDDWCLGLGRSPSTLLGRSQKIAAPAHLGSRALWIDVCHNPDGARAFVDALQAEVGQRKLPALVSILRDKAYDEILDHLRSALHPVILFEADSERSWTPDLLAPRHRDLVFCPSFEAAWSCMEGIQASTDPLTPWVICGSVFAVGQVFTWLDILLKDMHVARVMDGDWTWDAARQSVTPVRSSP